MAGITDGIGTISISLNARALPVIASIKERSVFCLCAFCVLLPGIKLIDNSSHCEPCYLMKYDFI